MALSLALLAVYPVAGADPVRIVAIGDSITAGGRPGVKEYTYRFPLQRMLRDEDACTEFVGARRGGLDPAAAWPEDGDTENEGFYGARTAEVRDRLAADLPAFAPPDIALVHLGTNDGKGFVEDDIVGPLKDIVAMLRARNPRVTVLLAEINGPRNFRTAYLHLRIDQLAASLNTAESVVRPVDQHTQWDIDRDTFDGVHPNLRGQRKMAERWLDAMKPYLRFGPQSCGDSLPSPLTLNSSRGR